MGPFVGLLTRDYHSWLESLAHIWGIILAGGEILGHGADADGLHATYVLVGSSLALLLYVSCS